MFERTRILLCALRGDPLLALAGVAWWLQGKRVRGRNRVRAAAAKSASYYDLWIRVAEPSLIRRTCKVGAPAGRTNFVAAIVGKECDVSGHERTLHSLRNAFGADLRIVQKPIELEEAAALGDQWLVAMRAGDVVHPQLARVLEATIAARPESRIVFWDEDRIEQGRRCDPWVKPDWNEALFLSRNPMAGCAAYRLLTDPERRRHTSFESFTVAATASAAANGDARARIVHVPLILTNGITAVPQDELAGRARLLSELWPGKPQLRASPTCPEGLEAIWALQTWPKVSIIIPTRDRADLLETCIGSLAKLEYPGEVETVIADNGSTEPDTLAYLESFRRTGGIVADCSGPFNFSAIVNRAVSVCSGEILCLLNNDVEAIDGSWLERLVRQAARPSVGAVGATLLYPDGTIQHAGVALGVGEAAGHVYRGLRPEQRGNGAMHRATRRVSAVTGACLVVRREAFLAVGGLDETVFAVAFNDVDFCLKLDAMGLENICVGEAVLIHAESKSRGSDMERRNVDRYRRELAGLQTRWVTRHALDPWHSALIRRASEDFVLDIDVTRTDLLPRMVAKQFPQVH